jgi:hypothetical protein
MRGGLFYPKLVVIVCIVSLSLLGVVNFYFLLLFIRGNDISLDIQPERPRSEESYWVALDIDFLIQTVNRLNSTLVFLPQPVFYVVFFALFSLYYLGFCS